MTVMMRYKEGVKRISTVLKTYGNQNQSTFRHCEAASNKMGYHNEPSLWLTEHKATTGGQLYNIKMVIFKGLVYAEDNFEMIFTILFSMSTCILIKEKFSVKNFR